MVCLTYTMVGTLFGSTDVTMVAFATQHGSRAYTGWLLAIISAGSCVGGLVYGSRHWRTSPERRFTLTVCSLAFFALGVALAPGLAVMAVAGAFMGVSIAPAIISSSLLIEKYCPADRLTEGFALIGSSLGVGFAVGASVSGRVIDHHSTHVGFGIGTCAVFVAAVVAVRGRHAARLPEVPVVELEPAAC
jgi:MFS family permease